MDSNWPVSAGEGNVFAELSRIMFWVHKPAPWFAWAWWWPCSSEQLSGPGSCDQRCCQAGGTIVMKESYYKGQSPLKGESTCCPKGQTILILTGKINTPEFL